jgi:zinc protease
MLDRKKTPELLSIDHISFVKPRIYDITGNVRLYFMKEVPNETSRLDLYFDAGSIRGEVGVASFVNGLLLSGTKDKSSTQIHNELDALGAFFESNVGHESGVVTIYALRENMISILKIIKDAIDKLAFHEYEVEEIISDRKQKFQVNLEKVSFLAQRAFQKAMFNNSAYGRIMEEQDYDNVTISELRTFHKENYLNGLTKVVVVGDFHQDAIDEIIDLTGSWAKEGSCSYESGIVNLPGVVSVSKDGALQTAIRMGKILFNKSHPDFMSFQVLNTILGDYFGSRLMTNIREDKGYTYGIGSMVAELHETGYFLIATEVGKDVTAPTLEEIKNEVCRLQEELVSEEELDLVKNYLLGQLLKSADGPYSMIDLYIGLEPYGLEMDYYNNAITAIKNITPEQIKELARKYLNWDEFTIVTAG